MLEYIVELPKIALAHKHKILILFLFFVHNDDVIFAITLNTIIFIKFILISLYYAVSMYMNKLFFSIRKCNGYMNDYFLISIDNNIIL